MIDEFDDRCGIKRGIGEGTLDWDIIKETELLNISR